MNITNSYAINFIYTTLKTQNYSVNLKCNSTQNISFRAFDTLELKNFNINFTGYKNLININPYKALENIDSSKAIEDYIKNGMFIHVPPIGYKKFGEVFWEHFMSLKAQLKDITDSDLVYLKLRELAEKLSSPEELDKSAIRQVSERATVLGHNVKSLLNENRIKIDSNSVYLDVGCGNGEVAKCISEELKINPETIKGIEIIDRDDFCNITRYKFDGKHIPESFEKSDFVTIFNVLHHTQNDQEAYELLNSIYKHMKPNGTLLIRDHNTSSDNDIMYWQIRHLLPIKVSKVDPPCLVQDTVYHSDKEWIKMLTDIGFKMSFERKDKPFGNIYSFYLAMQK